MSRNTAAPHLGPARSLAAVLCLAAAVLLTACSTYQTDTTSTLPAGETLLDTDAEAPTGTVLVFAAASLTDAFTEIEEAFESANPGTDVQISFGGSSSLRAQLLDGAPVDVFASADEANMVPLADAGLLEGSQQTFATNQLQIVVPADNPGAVTSAEDLSNPDLLIGLCAADVPCGELARLALAAAGVTPSLDTNEPDVRSLLTKIKAGELDAGIVYTTDAIAAGETVQVIPFDAGAATVANDPIAVLAAAPNRLAAHSFVEFVLSAGGQTILQQHGFGTP